MCPSHIAPLELCASGLKQKQRSKPAPPPDLHFALQQTLVSVAAPSIAARSVAIVRSAIVTGAPFAIMNGPATIRLPAAIIPRSVMARWAVIWRVSASRRPSCIVAGVRVIAPSARPAKSVAAPPVVVAPIGPWSHSQKDAIVKIPWPVISLWDAGIRSVIVVSVWTRWWRAERDRHLRIGIWNQGCRYQ
jgi:hypothetical protein